MIHRLSLAAARQFANDGDTFKPRDRRVQATQVTRTTEWITFTGERMVAQPGDWIITDGRHTWSVDHSIFSATSLRNCDGSYTKTTPVVAQQAESALEVETLEGVVAAAPGDWIVTNGQDAWVVSAEQFSAKYSRTGHILCTVLTVGFPRSAFTTIGGNHFKMVSLRPGPTRYV